MKIEKLIPAFVDEIVKLADDNYREEVKVFHDIPYMDNTAEKIYDSLFYLADNGLGVAAFERGDLVGYISGYPVDKMFGNVKGIFSPIHGHGAVKENRKNIYRYLYERAAETWVSRDIFNHAIALYAHDSEAVDTFFWNGFGLRCIDASRKAEPIEIKSSKYEIRRIFPKDARLIYLLELSLIKHLNSSPVFMPVHIETSIEGLEEWLSEENNYIWAAFDGEKVVAYLKLTEEGENFITSSPEMMNICGAYAIPEVRGTGVSAELLSYVMDFIVNKGISYCGVDFESINPAASGFWTKHFNPYTFSVVRRIDERIKSFR